MTGRIGDQEDVRNQRLDLCFALGVAVRRHQCGVVERGSAVADDGGQFGIAHFVERVELGKLGLQDAQTNKVGPTEQQAASSI
jgi:hypothetical protein